MRRRPLTRQQEKAMFAKRGKLRVPVRRKGKYYGTKLVPDKGEPGRTPKRGRWFKPKKHRGWSKDQKASTRRKTLMGSTDKRKSRHDRYVEAGRAMQALVNVTTNRETRRKAQSDADYFFRKAKKS